MFCSECGNQTNGKLRYCNSCGAKMAKNVEDDEVGKNSPLNSLITTIAFVALGGLGILIGLLAMLLKQGVNHEPIAIIAGMYLIALTAICFSLIRVMSKLIDSNTKEKAGSQHQVFQPVQLPAPNTAQLEEPKQQPFSVIDNTTRTFEKIPIKGN